MKILTSKITCIIAVFFLLSCNSSSTDKNASLSEDMAISKVDRKKIDQSNVDNYIIKSNFSALQSTMDDDREL
ncbi:hypothetical protein [Flagellimonas pacifica]|uniref:Uncharacterized protein n=1 Tax=Flagellimonas pacifica TaxID=1247520 RepID=A0A285MU24_9FLAO|nr:hypothetical protein [Allomuricauda parva]SNZ00699.1 hypothetical protein SAMN06265377_2524 [Allomuricauda parva]